MTLNLTEPLDPDKHDRAAFYSAAARLDEFLHQKARKEAELNLNKTFVLTSKQHPKEILGYYTLSAKDIRASDLSKRLSKKLPRYNELPVTLLGRFAVAEKYQRQGKNAPIQFGKHLLMDAKWRAWKASRSVGSYALVVDVLIDEEKGDPTPFYTKYDFIPFPDNSLCLYLPMSTIEKTLLVAGLIYADPDFYK